MTQPAHTGPTDMPYIAATTTTKKMVPTTKAYKDETFLNSHAARQIRIMCEFEEPAKRLSENGVLGTILFFGSARAMSPDDYAATTLDVEGKLAAAKTEGEKAPLEARLKKLKRTAWMSESYTQVQELSRRMTQWSLNNRKLQLLLLENPPVYGGCTYQDKKGDTCQPLIVCTGGGPG